MSDLKLNNVKPEDSGEYYCEAENKHGMKKSNIIQIDVKCEYNVLCKQKPLKNLMRNHYELQYFIY